MYSRFFSIFIMITMVQNLSVNCRPYFAPPTQAPQLDQLTMALKQGGNIIGSSPPRCEHKCYGCSPCEATQVPTTSGVTIQYSNYEPEGWKCKCGPSFYAP